MKMTKIEEVMYLARINLFFWDEENNHHDWREAEVISIENDMIVLDVSFDENVRYNTVSYTLDELADLCRELCDKHFETMKNYLASKK